MITSVIISLSKGGAKDAARVSITIYPRVAVACFNNISAIRWEVDCSSQRMGAITANRVVEGLGVDSRFCDKLAVPVVALAGFDVRRPCCAF